jgi:hypothetical protein
MPLSELERLSHHFTAGGRLIEAGWIGLRIAALPTDIPADQLTELRNSFFAGAHHLFASLMTILDPVDGVEPTAADLDRITLINAELKEFITVYAATRLPTKGTA